MDASLARTVGLREAFVSELISIIVTTYNREDALDAVLRSLSRQADRNFEVIAADDPLPPEPPMDCGLHL
jgi:GT2 family glycosyltransferase